MDVIIANVDKYEFRIEIDLREQFGSLSLPFQGMDKSVAAVCQFFDPANGMGCPKGTQCPFRHIHGDRTIVCKHWLRGLCKKGDQCEFLHEYDMKKMPECYFYSRFNACHNKECPFLHIDPESKMKDCPWYDRGFCRHGPHCRHRHVRRVLCMNYLAGFCPDGPQCKFMHTRFELPPIPEIPKDSNKRPPVCHQCGELGHKASTCKKAGLDPNSSTMRSEDNRSKFNGQLGNIGDFNAGSDNFKPEKQDGETHFRNKMSKPLDEITCFKCGNKGHYANKCPKGHLAFLSNHRNN